MPASDQLTRQERYQLIPRTLLFITCGEHILMVKGAPGKKLWANLYNGLGGHIERGESVLGAARRELLEESGLRLDDLRLVGVVTIDTGQNPGIGLYVVRGDLPQGRGFPPTSPNHEGSLEWVPLKDLLRLPLVEDLALLLPVVLATRPGAAPFSARYEYQEDGKLAIKFDAA